MTESPRRLRSSRRASAIAVVQALPALALPALAQADAWYATPQLAASAEYRSNADFASPARSGTLAAVDLALPVAWTDDRLEATLTPRARLAETSGATAASPEAYAMAAAFLRASERGALDVRAGWSDESTLDAEPDPTIPVRIDARRRRVDGAVGLTRALTERLDARFGAGWQRTYFGADARGLLVDFRSIDASVGLGYALTERIVLTASSAATRYRSDAVEQRSVSVQAGVRWTSAPTTTWRAEYGRSRATSDGVRAADGAVYLAAVEHRWPRSGLNVRVEQQVLPSGFGALTRTRGIDARWDWRWSERLTLDVSANDSSNRDVLTGPFGPVGFERRLRTAALGLAWQATPAWSIAGSVGWQRQSIGDAPEWRGGALATLATRRAFGRIRLD